MRLKHQAVIVVGLGFGDCGKGTITDALVRRHNADMVVRFNGGAQAAHAVALSDGRGHVFHQFGSGTFVPGVGTFLSRYMLVNPLTLFWEEQELREVGVTDAFERLTIDENALVTTPFHMAANRLREYARGAGRHGSCGLGIGETVADSLALFGEETLRIADLRDAPRLRPKMLRHRAYKQQQMEPVIAALRMASETLPPLVADAIENLYSDAEMEATLQVFGHIAERARIVEGRGFLAKRLKKAGSTLFEGAQGVLLDQDWGFPPYHTWSDTTASNALALLEAADFFGPSQVIGVLRSYSTRHGAGPFPTEDQALTAALSDSTNPTNAWQGGFRVGWFDLCLARYATEAAGRIDALALTCLDRFPQNDVPKVGVGYDLKGEPFALTPGERTNSEHRAALAVALGTVNVTYCAAPGDAEQYAAWIAEKMHLPLEITSWGPTAQQKR